MTKAQLPPNPLVTMRKPDERSQPDYSKILGVSRSVVCCAENGQYQTIPVCYRNLIRDIRQINKEYQEFRYYKRLFFWDPASFPEYPAKRDPLTQLIEHFNLNSHAFADRICITDSEVYRMCTVKRNLNENLREAFEQIGLPGEWIDEFDAALRFNGTTRVSTGTSTTRT